MNFVLDASVTMAWLLGDTKPSDRLYAQKILNALKVRFFNESECANVEVKSLENFHCSNSKITGELKF